MKNFFQSLLDNEESLEEFGEWAFGATYKDISIGMEFLYAWNVLHGDVLHLNADSFIGEDAPKMIQLWRNYNDTDLINRHAPKD